MKLLLLSFALGLPACLLVWQLAVFAMWAINHPGPAFFWIILVAWCFVLAGVITIAMMKRRDPT